MRNKLPLSAKYKRPCDSLAICLCYCMSPVDVFSTRFFTYNSVFHIPSFILGVVFSSRSGVVVVWRCFHEYLPPIFLGCSVSEMDDVAVESLNRLCLAAWCRLVLKKPGVLTCASVLPLFPCASPCH